MLKYIQNEDHYREVLAKAAGVKESLWIGTADIKDLHFEKEPFLGVLAELLKRGVDVRLIHAKEPGPIFREAYIGSANLTGAGIGMKGPAKRNFEAGVLTDDFTILDAACNQFDQVWTGAHCAGYGRRDICGAPVK